MGLGALGTALTLPELGIAAGLLPALAAPGLAGGALGLPAIAGMAAMPELAMAVMLLPLLGGGAVLPAMLPPLVAALTLAPIGLATGGVVTEPSIHLLGEAGPEAVVPLSGSLAGQGIGDTIINIDASSATIQSQGDLDSFQQSIENAVTAALNKKNRMMGLGSL